MTLRLAAALAPSPQNNLLDLSAGLGGGARALHERYGAQVTGMEARPVLAKLGAAESFNRGTAKNASVEHYDPQSLTARELFSGILVRETLFHQPHLGEVLARAAKALKPRGQIVLVDYVRVEHENPNSRYLAWMDAERQPVHPWSAKQYRAACEQLGLELSEFEDMTDSYRKTVIEGWATFLAGLHLKDLGEGEAAALVDEAELWLRRIMAFEHSALRVIRIHATAPAGR
ncbi:MAG: methyltransferase domain-containing protein [Alphaproteobacteria bacterium]|nr:methyltransferase domain-containing protein [Alphaproteobacteria bacterium]